MLAREGILALRRAKQRNMTRICLACGGESINSLDMLSDVNILGFAERVEEQTLDEETYTFIEGVKNPCSHESRHSDRPGPARRHALHDRLAGREQSSRRSETRWCRDQRASTRCACVRQRFV